MAIVKLALSSKDFNVKNKDIGKSYETYLLIRKCAREKFSSIILYAGSLSIFFDVHVATCIFARTSSLYAKAAAQKHY